MNTQFLYSIFFCNAVVLPIYFLIQQRQIKNLNYSGNNIRKFFLFLFIVYVTSLAAITIIPLPIFKNHPGYLNLDPFHQTYNNFLSAINHTSDRTVWHETENLLGNIILFFPLGFLLPILSSKYRYFIKILFVGFIASLFIETVQFFFSIEWHYGRLSDIDDVILNTVGAIIGFLFYKILVTTKIFNSKFQMLKYN